MVTSLIIADQVVKSDSHLNIWGKQLRRIIHEAEDVIDEFYLKTLIRKRLRSKFKATFIAGMVCSSVTNPKFVHNIGVRIEKINANATKLKENKDYYGSFIAQATSGGAESSNSPSSLRSLHQKIKRRRAAIFAEVYQQNNVNIHEGVVRQVLPLLTIDEGGDHDKAPLRVISILGMGGVGKTTLAKKLYNLSNGFDYRALVYVSKSYRPEDLLRNIMNQCFGPIGEQILKLSNERLYVKLSGKKYLIVLDDVWDTDVWEDLRSWFPHNDNGSIVLLTTRHKNVANLASSSCSTNIHELNVINENQSWQMFENRVHPDPELKSLGEEMVKKCRGIPLAIVVLGGLLLELNMQRNAWAAVKASARWISSQNEDSYKCLGILALSYDYMPYYLKQCFLYTSLFPENHNISVTKLYQYWIAEGFVNPTGEQTMEDAAETYLDDLIGRNLIQVSGLNYDGKVKSYRIHDLIRDICLAESKNVQFSQVYNSVDEFYHENPGSERVAVYCKSDALNKQGFPDSLGTGIRFLMCQNVLFKQHNYFSSLCGGFKSLRVLEFSRYNQESRLISFPKEVGELIHLRYLSFEKTELQEIDTSYLRKLVNLETLNLNNCIDELMMDDKIWSLCKLRHLYLKSIRPTSNNRKSRRFSTVYKFGISQSKKDKLGIDKLKNLQVLQIGAGDWMNGGRLEKLSSLRKLRIEECLLSQSEKISSAVAELTNLQSLALISKISYDPPLTDDGIRLVSIQLSNHTSLTRLHLKGKIHDWSKSISLPPELRKLKLERSLIVDDPMPILEKLRFLTFLNLGYFSYSGKQMVCSKGGFGNLQTLIILSLENLETWMIKKGALASLTKLDICGCKNLKMIPDGLQQLTTLKELTVANMPTQFLSRMIPGGEGGDWDKIQHIHLRNMYP